jgi:hypothetical protein
MTVNKPFSRQNGFAAVKEAGLTDRGRLTRPAPVR